LGDSFTFALGVRFEDLYVQRLERMLDERQAPTRFQVINAGVAGYNTRQELLYLQARGLAFSPDLITVAFYWNDLLGNGGALPDPATTPLYAEMDPFEQDAGHTLPPWLRNALRRSRLLYLGVSRTKNALAALGPPDEISLIQRALLQGDQAFLAPYWEATAQRLHQIADEGRKHGIPVLLVAFPMENQILREYPAMVWGERLREIWEPTGMPFIDLEAPYRQALASGVNPFLPYDLHPGPAGMQIAAEAIYEAVVPAPLLAQAALP
jgi:lysophospholipase L1-like esterase